MSAEVQLGKYQHFKGDYYDVIGVAKDSDTLKEYVIYRGKYYSSEFGNQPYWIRPKENFLEIIQRDGVKIPRFKYLGP